MSIPPSFSCQVSVICEVSQPISDIQSIKTVAASKLLLLGKLSVICDVSHITLWTHSTKIAVMSVHPRLLSLAKCNMWGEWTHFIGTQYKESNGDVCNFPCVNVVMWQKTYTVGFFSLKWKVFYVVTVHFPLSLFNIIVLTADVRY
jgi:hypothetical protein